LTTIRVTSGYTPPENAYTGSDPGPHVVTLVAIQPAREIDDSFNPGQKRMVQEWQFEIIDGPYTGQLIWDSWVTAPKDGNVHPKSTFFGYMTALFGGRAAPEGAEIDIEQHLIGKAALATTELGEKGVRIVNLGAVPAIMAPAKTAPAAKPPLREQVAATPAAGDLPF
jgi:hypothetical protein